MRYVHIARGAIYERVRQWDHRIWVGIALSPHRLRRTIATHLARKNVRFVTIRDLLGHRQLTGTQIYLHVTAEDLRVAAAAHPSGALLRTVELLLLHSSGMQLVSPQRGRSLDEH